jgi:hypothetical protein
VATWFGRGRVQERAEDSDDTSVPDDAQNGSSTGSTETDSANAAPETAPETASSLYATNEDVRSLAAAADAVRA